MKTFVLWHWSGILESSHAVYSCETLDLAYYHFTREVQWCNIDKATRIGDFAIVVDGQRGPVYQPERLVICELGKLDYRVIEEEYNRQNHD
jgi:hypothetical protein